jgi:hypothetical protein
MTTTDDICKKRHKGNAESAAAFESSDYTNQGEAVYAFVEPQNGATTDEVAAAFGMMSSSISARMSELRKSGRIGPRNNPECSAPASEVGADKFN